MGWSGGKNDRIPSTDQTLIFDTDDTLWQNNFLFERVIDDFTAWLDHPRLDPVAVWQLFDEFAALLTSGAVELIPSVGAVLTDLGARPSPYLMTNEQQRKTSASGLAKHFAGRRRHRHAGHVRRGADRLLISRSCAW